MESICSFEYVSVSLNKTDVLGTECHVHMLRPEDYYKTTFLLSFYYVWLGQENKNEWSAVPLMMILPPSGQNSSLQVEAFSTPYLQAFLLKSAFYLKSPLSVKLELKQSDV